MGASPPALAPPPAPLGLALCMATTPASSRPRPAAQRKKPGLGEFPSGGPGPVATATAPRPRPGVFTMATAPGLTTETGQWSGDAQGGWRAAGQWPVGARRGRDGALRKRRGLGENAGQPPPDHCEAVGPRQGSPSVAREENPALLIPLAAQNVNCQRFFCGHPFFCHDSTGQMERIRSALRVCAIQVKEETRTKQDKSASLLHVFQALTRSISSLITADGES
ncbi:uncharacterized protein LOC141750579 [Larus michahellis]|uniref:uncharacterized protein LOC141750579 n=1 Tax=Larus michahellis TaxID=119627 RepID=UPI003D9B17D4